MTFSPSEAELCGPHLTSGRFNNSSFFFGFVSTHFISPHHEALRLQLSSSSSSSWFFFFFSPHKSVSHLNALFKKKNCGYFYYIISCRLQGIYRREHIWSGVKFRVTFPPSPKKNDSFLSVRMLHSGSRRLSRFQMCRVGTAGRGHPLTGWTSPLSRISAPHRVALEETISALFFFFFFFSLPLHDPLTPQSDASHLVRWSCSSSSFFSFSSPTPGRPRLLSPRSSRPRWEVAGPLRAVAVAPPWSATERWSDA